MIHFSQKQILEIIDILDKTHWMFIAKNVNDELVPKNVMKDLIKMGFKKTQVTRFPELAMQFGLLSVYLKDKEVKSLTFNKLKQIIKAKKFLPLSEVEKQALSVVETRAMNDIRGLGNRVNQQLQTIMIEADNKQRHQYEEIIRNAAKKAIKRREGVKFVRSEVGHKLNDWARDLDRIGDYILHEAYDTGRALAIKKQKGGDAKVFKRVHKDACSSCKSLFLKNQKTWEPRIFTIDELLSNGTNIGRKRDQWRATLSPVHPYCRCDVEYIPIGHVWSNKSQRFVPDTKVKNKYNFKNLATVTTNKKAS